MDHSTDLISQVGEALELSAEPEQKGPVTCCVEFALLPEHLADYADQSGNLASTQKAEEKDVQALRARHHGVARLLAEGVPEGVVAEMTGYTASYISTLKNNPAMIQLVEFYRAPKTDAAKLIGEKLRVLGDMSTNLLLHKMENEPEKLTASELTAIAKLGFDRSGNGPNSTVTNVQEHRLVATEEVLELSKSARRNDRSRIVDVEVVRSSLPKKEPVDEESRTTSPGHVRSLPDRRSDSDESGSS
jgi:hypothetical protein